MQMFAVFPRKAPQANFFELLISLNSSFMNNDNMNSCFYAFKFEIITKNCAAGIFLGFSEVNLV